MAIKAVIDTNIWISYFINARADYLVRWIINHDLPVFTSDQLIDELTEVLKRPKFRLPFPAEDFVNLHKQACIHVKPAAKFKLAPDPDDNFLFDICLKSKAEFLITSDRKLIDFPVPFDLSVMTFNEFRSLFGQ